MEAFDAIEPFEWLDAVDWWGTTADTSSISTAPGYSAPAPTPAPAVAPQPEPSSP
ncbi:hypothetical protein [Paenibacillus xanthanilyticus]|uniref:Uncharacterized protein n=1 Tax=Paenibacillus xanthanilyticus TaxID=1783531 RepID=A0ABV8K3D0_9BACL